MVTSQHHDISQTEIKFNAERELKIIEVSVMKILGIDGSTRGSKSQATHIYRDHVDRFYKRIRYVDQWMKAPSDHIRHR